jgi:hypothetical protein
MNTNPLNSLPDTAQNYRGLFIAKITGVTTPSTGPLAGRPVYDWIEQIIDNVGGDVDANPARQATYISDLQFDGCLVDVNDAVIDVDQKVWARMKGRVAGQTIYETISDVSATTSGGSPGTGDDCGLLLSFPYSKAWKLTGLTALGLCDCFDETQGTNPDEPFLLINTDQSTTWVGTRTFETCCGCGRITLTITNDDLDGRVPDATLVIEINQRCDEDPPTFGTDSDYTYTFRLEGCYAPDSGNPYLIFSLSGIKNCNTEFEFPPGYPCKNDAGLKLECVPCDGERDCGNCTNDEGPVAFYADLAEAFSGDYAKYNGKWTLTNDEADTPCVWSLSCGGIGMTLTLSYDEGDDEYTATLVLTGADGGSLTYTITQSTQFGCIGSGIANLAYDGEEVPTGAPATISLDPISCAVPLFGQCRDSDFSGFPLLSTACFVYTNLAMSNLYTEGDPVGCINEVESYSQTGVILGNCGALCPGGWCSFPQAPETEACPGGLLSAADLAMNCIDGEWHLQNSCEGAGRPSSPVLDLIGEISADGTTITFGPYSGTVTYSAVPPNNLFTMSWDSVVVTLGDCPMMMMAAPTSPPAPRAIVGTAGVKKPEAKPKPLPVLPPCPFEGAVLKKCTGCGSNGQKAEARHLRACSNPENPTGQCSRTYTAPDTGKNARYACDDCPVRPT